MIGSFIYRGLVLIFGYAYPAYECFKAVELNKPEIEQLRFWCQYWILVAGMTVCERICDVLIGWVPMYGEVKLAFFIYLWYPKTKGTTYVYESFFRPYIAKHETEIDRNLSELRTRAGDMIILYWKIAVSHGQTRFFQILQYVASHSSPWVAQQVTTTTSNHRSAHTKQAQDEQPSSPVSSTSSSENQEDMSEEAEPSKSSKDSPPCTVSTEQKIATALTVVEPSKISNPTHEMQNKSVPSTECEEAQILLEDIRPVTRAMSRKTRSVTSP
ncbi:putative HVA22-like protein g [Henckelia pumila]|uniref:putative HVA22-like protein g n=1 Tax=Henckelia pumila TaxID=405737 RepID=UPI003C6DC0A7